MTRRVFKTCYGCGLEHEIPVPGPIPIGVWYCPQCAADDVPDLMAQPVEPTATLPALNRDELIELAEAITSRGRMLEAILKTYARDNPARARVVERLAITRSLATAVLEAGTQVRRQR